MEQRIPFTVHTGCRSQFTVISNIVAERYAQDQKWGPQHHEPEWYNAILVEEAGEVSKELCECLHRGKTWDKRQYRKLYEELVQTAAVATAFAEEIHRRMEEFR